MHRSLTQLLFLAFTFGAAGTSYPQSGTSPAPVPRLAVIDSKQFESDAAQYNPYAEVYIRMEKEFSPQIDELNKLQNEIKILGFEIEGRSKDAACKIVDCSQSIIKKLDLAKQLTLEFERRTAEAQLVFHARTAELRAPVDKRISEALKRFAAENGFDVVVDISKCSPSLGDFSRYENITSRFITYYRELEKSER